MPHPTWYPDELIHAGDEHLDPAYLTQSGQLYIAAGAMARLSATADVVLRQRGVDIRTGTSVEEATRTGVRLSDGTDRSVDHLLLGTGYQVDVARYAFLAPSLVSKIHRVKGYPVLGSGFETSVPGLHILGAPAARTVGPIMQFVSGTRYAGPALAAFFAPRYGARLAPQWQLA